MVAKKRGRKRAGLAWRLLFGQHGPTKKALKKAVVDLVGPKTIASIAHDPKTGKLVTKNLIVDKRSGQITLAPKKTAGKARGKSSITSRTSGTACAGQSRQRITVQQQPRQQRAKSLAERTNERRRPDGTLNGSTPAVDPKKVAAELQRIRRRVAELEAMTDRDLGWDREV